MEIRQLNMQNEKEIMGIIKDAFAVDPWYDNWDDEEIFHLYILDVIGNVNSLALGLYEGNELVGVSLGRLKHWFNGTEYCIDDFCIRSSCQGKGAGSLFLKMLRAYGRKKNYKKITLRTKRTASAYEFYKKNGFREIEEDVFFSMECNI